MTSLRLTAELPDDLIEQIALRAAQIIEARMADGPPASEPNDVLLTPAEVAGRVRVHVQTVYRHLRTGRLPGQRIGSRWRIPAEAVSDCFPSLDKGAPSRRSGGHRPPARGRQETRPLR